jgi:hypothetical protein
MSSPCVRAAVPQKSSSLTQIVRRLRHERNHSVLPSPRPPSPSICRHVGWSAPEDEKQASFLSSAGPLPDQPCFDAIELFLRSLENQQIEALEDVAAITSGRCKSEAEYKAEYVSTRDSGLSFLDESLIERLAASDTKNVFDARILTSEKSDTFHADLLRKYAPDAEWASCKSCGMRLMYIMQHAAHVHATCGSCKSCGSQIQLNEEDIATNKDAAPQDALRGKKVSDTELMPNRRTWADALDTDQEVMVPDKPLSFKLGGGLGSLEGTYGTTIAIQYSVPNSDANSICDNHLTSKPSMSPSTRGAANISEPSNALGRHTRSNACGSSWKEWSTQEHQESYSTAMLQLPSLTLPNLLAVKLLKRQPVAMIF